MIDMDEKEEHFFEQLLKDEKDIAQNYAEALNDWDKGLFKINFPFISRKKVQIDIKEQKTR